MKLSKNKNVFHDFNKAAQHEWIETNGLGGWASSTITGCNTRRYHGLLVAGTNPPAERMNLVSKMDETIAINNQRFELGTNNYGEVIHPKGYGFTIEFTKDLFPVFTYQAGGVLLQKTIAMVHGKNTTLVVYDVMEAPQPFVMELLPLLSVRDYHSMMRANDSIRSSVSFGNDTFKSRAYEGTPEIFIKVPGGHYHHNPNWYYNFNYAVEQYRGMEYIEDLFSPGTFSVELKQGDKLGVIISTDDTVSLDANALLTDETLRRQLLLQNQPDDETIHQLVLAADQFIVKRDEDLKTVIAGYHWFTDWGRDTMISLPGLCLATGRYDDAKKILAAFAKSVSMGMLPNRFQDNGEAPEYNNVDGTLWYFIAVYKYLQASGNSGFVLQEILPVLKDIIHWHRVGTRFHIHDTDDGLLYSGEAGVQLTWMDAKIGDWVVTPRTGKAVEVNALWYNAIKIYAKLLQKNNETALAKEMEEKATHTKQSFNQQFWNNTAGYLYDVIDGDNKDDTLRPNQLFAISLPFNLMEDRKAIGIFNAVKEKLYTPVGLRSLPADHPGYVGIYGGDVMHRDSSYHQGTVWSWLLGPYIDAIMLLPKYTGLNGLKNREHALKVIENFKYHLNEGCIGSVSEIFDGDAPHTPRGCIAQAWGVAEVLRVIKEYSLHAMVSVPVYSKLVRAYDAFAFA